MKNLKKIGFVLTLMATFFITRTSFISAEEYLFSPAQSLIYSFKINGDIEHKSSGIMGQSLDIVTEGVFKLELLEEKKDKYIIKLTPCKTFIKLNETVLEDMRKEETSISKVISSSILEIAKNGSIISTKEVTSGMIDMSQIFKLVPAFPEKLYSGRKWKQSLSPFALPGVPMCNMDFVYTYMKAPNTLPKIKVVANQAIKEKKQNRDVIINFTGKNSSNGQFVFDNTKGRIETFSGKFNLILNTTFSIPSQERDKKSTTQSMPMNMDIKLDIELKVL
ncbi:hypothetical protein M0P98_02695 [bacterium]|nr:hypothetical protein [bacterium]